MKWDVDLIIIAGGSWRRDCGVGVRQKSYRPGVHVLFQMMQVVRGLYETLAPGRLFLCERTFDIPSAPWPTWPQGRFRPGSSQIMAQDQVHGTE